MSVIWLVLRVNLVNEVSAESGAMSVIWLLKRHQIHDFAAQKIQSFMNAPVIQNTLTRAPTVIRPHVYSVKPTDRSRAQMRDMKRRVDGFVDPGGRGIAQLRTRLGSVIDRGR
eukprot:SAG22_NODE_52_length_24288_cov_15.594568_12_plen_113_part_00